MSSIPVASGQLETGQNRGLVRGGIALVLFLAPALGALAWFPDFSTQDGPAHLYNARILSASFNPDSPFQQTYEVAWSPIPNWSGHLGTMALLAVFRPDVAARVMTGITLVALAASIVWLRWVVAGSKGLVMTAMLAVLLALNVTWLLGFTSFLLGSALLPITLGVWWGGREWFGPGRALGVGALLVLGYFSHPISLGMTIAGLGWLTVLTPGVNRVSRAAWTAASLVPLVPLSLAYMALTRSAGGLSPVWQFLSHPWMLQSWLDQAGWVDPLTLASRTYLPFAAQSSAWFRVFSPALWTAVALLLLIGSSWRGRSSDRNGWLIFSALLLLAGIFGPDTLGVKHGHYLPQRVLLLGLVALVPWLDFDKKCRASRLSMGLLLGAWAIQSAFVWDYAKDCQKVVGEVVKAGPSIGSHQRLGTLLVGTKRRYRANPVLHVDCLLGVENDHVIWNNYETTHYYFPVKVRPGLDHPASIEFERLLALDAPGEMDERVRRWELLLKEHSRSIDAIMVWSEQAIPRLDAINGANGYQETFREGSVRIWTRSGSLARLPREPR